MGKILLIISIALTAIAAGLSFVNHGKLETVTQGLADSKDQLQRAQASLAKSDAEVKKDKDLIATLQSSSDQKDQAIAAANDELTKVKAQVDDLNKQNQDVQTQLTAANAQITALKLAAAAPQASATPSVDIADLQAQLQEQKARADKLQADVDSTRSQLEVFKKAEETRKIHELANGIEGRVLAVNSAWNFVVLSLGDRSGVSNNTELLIKRGTQFVGRVRVTSVSPSTSIADIVANSVPQGFVVQPGDNVIYQQQNADDQQQ